MGQGLSKGSGGRTPGAAGLVEDIQQGLPLARGSRRLHAAAFCWGGIAEQPGLQGAVAVLEEGLAALPGLGELSGVLAGLQGLLLAIEGPLHRAERIGLWGTRAAA